MTEQEFEVAHLAKYGFPAWSQFLREGLAEGKNFMQLFKEHADIKVAELIANGGRPNK